MNGRPIRNGTPGISDRASETRQPMRCPCSLVQKVMAYPTLFVESTTVRQFGNGGHIPKAASETSNEADMVHNHEPPTIFGRRYFTVGSKY